MKAMILAAGRGERMRPLTDTCPKPLLQVKGVPLIEYHIKNLVAAGIKDIVINYAWLGQKLVEYLGNGAQYGANIEYSEEKVALETAGGIIKALPLLTQNDDVFVVVNGDVYTDYCYINLFSEVSPNLPLGLQQFPEAFDAHIMLVENPEHNLKGDFQLEDGRLVNPEHTEQRTYTFSGIAVYHQRFFEPSFKQDSKQALSEKTLSEKTAVEQTTAEQTPPEQGAAIQKLAPMLRASADKRRISASVLNAAWTDVGTPERLAKLNEC